MARLYGARKGCQVIAQAAVPGGVLRAERTVVVCIGAGASTG